jgi:hypothetical protein
MAHRSESIFVTLVTLAPPALTATAAAQEHVRAVPPGREVRESKLLSAGVRDVWHLDVERDEMLDCVVESGAFDPLLELVDASGERLGSDDGAGTRSELWLRMRAKGTVSFRVQAYRGSGGGNYSFVLRRFQSEALASDAKAIPHVFGPEQWWHWRVSLRAGDVLVPTVRGEGRLAEVFDAQRVPVGCELGGYRAWHEGDYFLRVEGGEGKSCRMEARLARQGPFPEARALEATLPPFGLDHWRFAVRAGETLVLDLEMPQQALGVELVDLAPGGRGPCLATPGHFDKGGHLRRYYLARRDGGLELRLRNTDAAAAAYRARLVDPDRELRIGTAAEGKLAVGDGALHRLGAAGGQLLRVSLQSRAFDGKLDVWDPWGNVIASADDAGPLDPDPTCTLLVRHPGTYRVLAHCAGGIASGEYRLLVEELAVPSLEVGGRLAVELTDRGTGHAHLRLEAGQEVWLSVRSAAFDSGLTVLDPTGDDAFRCEGGGCGGDVLVAYKAAHAGVHTLLVHSRGGAGPGEVRVVAP